MNKVRLGIRNRKNKKGETQIYLIYSFSREQRTEMGTGIYIQPEFWLSDKQEIHKKHNSATEYNNHLFSQKNKLEGIYLDLVSQDKTPYPETVSEVYLGKEVSRNKDVDFFKNIDEWIDRRKNQVSIDSWKDYRSLKKHLLGFQTYSKKKIRFEHIDFVFYEDLVSYLQYDVLKPNGEFGLAPNTVGKQIKNFKLFLINTMRKKLVQPIDLGGFKVTQKETDSVYLTESELEQIEALKFPENQRRDLIRDLFLVGCETGLRFSDFVNLKKESIQDNVIKLTTRKTLRPVIILISPRLKRIIKKYGDSFPQCMNKTEFNKLIKTIVKQAGVVNSVQMIKVKGNQKVERWTPKYELIASHTCRRTFCTNAFLRGIPTVVIRSASGHSSEKMLFKYIKISEIEAAENALKFMDF